MTDTTEYRVVDRVTRETAELLRGTGATIALDDEQAFVLEPIDSGGGDER